MKKISRQVLLNGQIINFDLINCRYVKLVSLSNNQSQWAGLYEAEFWGENINPVELTSFSADSYDSDIRLNWSTSTEKNNHMFLVQRKKINDRDFSTIGTVLGKGTTTIPQSYNYLDRNVRDGLYAYRLQQVDFNGDYIYSNSIDVIISNPLTLLLEQNYPNPFNPTTTIKFSVSGNDFVILKIYDVLGKEVTTLVKEDMKKGNYHVEFNASNLPSGIYFSEIRAGNNMAVKKMILLK